MRNSRRIQISVNGTVQGVGFRPFIYRIASELGITGHVCNTSDGVLIEAQGTSEILDLFVRRIKLEVPPLAHIQEISVAEMEYKDGETFFAIIMSRPKTNANTEISPDIVPCDDCVNELLNPKDRRGNYPFINCTNCGPRYTIIKALPYDRPHTTMQPFEMCKACADEYANPLDRRFHAQPDACAECGPELLLVRLDGHEIERTQNPLEETLKELTAGKIVAIKGVGGFHLACDATNTEAVALLRKRKLRDEKPFAVMVTDIEMAKNFCEISETEEKLITSRERPIVLLKKKNNSTISNTVAPNNKNLGLMLPSTPLHHLMLKSFNGPLVMTSGNISDEPITHTNEEALSKLSDIADVFLTHNRDIHIRIDDSITRVIDSKPLVTRRARGYVPAPIRLNFDLPSVLAAGGDIKGAIAITKGKNVILSQYLGDLENLDAYKNLEYTANHLTQLFNVKPKIIAHDLHPDYFSTRFAVSRFCDVTTPRIAIQHHHAHIASCMAENDLPNEQVIGIALDGTGFGTDGTSWGGEILLANYEKFERAAYFSQVLMPGGDIAAKEPWRMALSYLIQNNFAPSPSPLPRGERMATLVKNIGKEKIKIVTEMIRNKINCPITSSCGRLFDAVASIIGLRHHSSFEGQAAMELEQIADEKENGLYDFEILENKTVEISYAPTIKGIVADLNNGILQSAISAKFHNTVISALARACLIINPDKSTNVCLSGGCFQNEILATGLKKKLEAEGFEVYTHSLVPPNDGGIALGQAVIAAHVSRNTHAN